LIDHHMRKTNSRTAAALLSDWSAAQQQFIRVQPIQHQPVPPVSELELAAAGK
jgi:glutamate synthase domain-containing protein 3